VDAVSVGGESHVNTGVGCYKNFDHAMSGGCLSLRKDSLGPPSMMPNPSATNLLDLSSTNNTVNNDNQMTTSVPPYASSLVSSCISILFNSRQRHHFLIVLTLQHFVQLCSAAFQSICLLFCASQSNFVFLNFTLTNQCFAQTIAQLFSQ